MSEIFPKTVSCTRTRIRSREEKMAVEITDFFLTVGSVSGTVVRVSFVRTSLQTNDRSGDGFQ